MLLMYTYVDIYDVYIGARWIVGLISVPQVGGLRAVRQASGQSSWLVQFVPGINCRLTVMFFVFTKNLKSNLKQLFDHTHQEQTLFACTPQM